MIKTYSTKHIVIDKADPMLIDQKVPNILIEIVGELPDQKTIQDCENHHESQATLIESALFNSLPQGTYDRLGMKFMQRKVSLYRGITE